MKLIPTAAVTALVLGGLATATGTTAAEPSVFGTYTFEAEDGENATWTLAPCAPDSAGCVRVSETGSSQRAPWTGDAHLSVGSWIMFVSQPDAILCADGTAVPGVNTYSWDAAALTGSVSILSRGACGTKPASISIPFALTKTGAGPAQYPTAPIDVEPLVVDPPTAAAPAAPAAPGVPPPATGPLPAEAPQPQIMPTPAGELSEAEVAEPGFNTGSR